MVPRDRIDVPMRDRPWPARMRPDLQVRAQWFRGLRHYAVKDPISLRYYHLLEEEFAILRMLDGERSPAAIQQDYAHRFAPHRLAMPNLQRLLNDFDQKGLVLAEQGDSSLRLLKRGRQRRWTSRLEAWRNPLAIRLPGVDPERWLRNLAHCFRWFYTRTTLFVGLLLASAAGLLLAVHWNDFQSSLPDVQTLLTARYVMELGLALAAVKVAHELGHAIACKLLGGECHEIGLMLLVGTPCLYCDVSDAWLFPRKWDRISVSAAGMFVELWLASAGVFVWWYTQPGLLNSLALNIVLVCSVGTFVFNGNPLMRFDGYFIFADLIEIPNLNLRARAAWLQLLQSIVFGIDSPTENATRTGERVLLVGYALASWFYRCLVLVGIFLVLSSALEPYRLESLALILVALAVAGMLLMPVIRQARWLANPLMRRQIRTQRLLVSAGVLTIAFLAMAAVPFPCRVQAPLWLELQEATPVYVTAPGTLQNAVAANTRVRAGDRLGRLTDPDLDRQILAAQNRREAQALRLRDLQARRATRRDVAALIPTATESLADADERLRQLNAYRDLLTLKAPVTGTVHAPPRLPKSEALSHRLSTWSGSPLEEANRGCFLEAGTLLCVVAESNRMEATAVIEQQDLDLVRAGQSVRIILHQQPMQVVRGVVRQTARTRLDVGSRLLAAAGDLSARYDATGAVGHVTTAYQARIALDRPPSGLLVGAPGRCAITVEPQSLAQRLLRYVSRTFRLGN